MTAWLVGVCMSGTVTMHALFPAVLAAYPDRTCAGCDGYIAPLDCHDLGKRYELRQFHFHRPSEERVNGRAYDMVVHLVHRNDEGQLAVVAVLLEKGGENPLIQTLWNNMPLERDMETSPAGPLDLMQLLPDNRGYWIYMGSLTTPPCTEGVLWMVMKQPVQVSAEQVAIFSRLYRNNARPVQASNGRLIKESR